MFVRILTQNVQRLTNNDMENSFIKLIEESIKNNWELNALTIKG